MTKRAFVFGGHTANAGGIHMAALRAGNAGMRALQCFTAPPQYYGDKVSVKTERVQRFSQALEKAGIKKEHVVVHAAYVLNAASPDPDKYERSKAGLAKELERCTALGVGAFCFHPGSAGSSDVDGAMTRVADAITNALESVRGGTKIFIENTAGAGRTVGRTAEEIGTMLSRIPSKLRDRAGYGLDTCHLYASGHDIAKSEAELRAVLDAFTDAAGEGPSFFHLNDSEGKLGSNKDRHVLLGEGEIGVDAFRWLLADPRARGVPLILETPQLAEPEDDDDAADPNDLRMIALLEKLAG